MFVALLPPSAALPFTAATKPRVVQTESGSVRGHIERGAESWKGIPFAAPPVGMLLVVPSEDRILGATIIGAYAGDLIGQITLAMKHGIGLNGILATMHAYPTMMEANRFAAGEWEDAQTRALARLGQALPRLAHPPASPEAWQRVALGPFREYAGEPGR